MVYTKGPVPGKQAVPVMPRKAAPLGLALDAASAVPLHKQIGQQIRAAILERRLAPGLKLPSSRLMAAELGCARGTILLAMDQLVAEGYVTAQAASGLSVAANLPDEMLVSPKADRRRSSSRHRGDVRGLSDRLPDRPARSGGLPVRAVGQVAGTRLAPALVG